MPLDQEQCEGRAIVVVPTPPLPPAPGLKGRRGSDAAAAWSDNTWFVDAVASATHIALTCKEAYTTPQTMFPDQEYTMLQLNAIV